VDRRSFLGLLGGAALSLGQETQAAKPDIAIEIGPVTVDLGEKNSVRTTGYNGQAPGPILRVPEGKTICVDVFNNTDLPELVHWHGFYVPSSVDGSAEEGTPHIPPGGRIRLHFTANPSGTRWYHTHIAAGRNMDRGLYTGQFGFFYIEPKNDPGAYDQEIFLALKEWDPFLTTMTGMGDSLDVAYKRFSINDRALGHGEPIRVKQGQRILLRILNASATLHRRIGASGHRFNVLAMDGNPVVKQAEVEALELGPAERIDALITMNQPGVWILGSTDDHDRNAGMGIVIEYANQSGPPRWLSPGNDKWDYAQFGNGGVVGDPASTLPLVFKKKFISSHWVDKWLINGKEFPKTDPIRVSANDRYRLIFDNQSDEAHPVHLHRHTFELCKVEGVPTSGVRKDVVVVRPKTQVEAMLIANDPGPSLFHCHNQLHMDFGFMALMEYA
jgi:FtsP/CotA-like multicopper oxidase with cupredoxin domain